MAKVRVTADALEIIRSDGAEAASVDQVVTQVLREGDLSILADQVVTMVLRAGEETVMMDQIVVQVIRKVGPEKGEPQPNVCIISG